MVPANLNGIYVPGSKINTKALDLWGWPIYPYWRAIFPWWPVTVTFYINSPSSNANESLIDTCMPKMFQKHRQEIARQPVFMDQFSFFQNVLTYLWYLVVFGIPVWKAMSLGEEYVMLIQYFALSVYSLEPFSRECPPGSNNFLISINYVIPRIGSMCVHAAV